MPLNLLISLFTLSFALAVRNHAVPLAEVAPIFPKSSAQSLGTIPAVDLRSIPPGMEPDSGKGPGATRGQTEPERMVTDRRYGYGEPYITPRDGKMTNDKAVNIETTSTRLAGRSETRK